jgi:asparagine synthase (glutamine-hydrolysing)
MDESPFARDIARHLGLEHECVLIEPKRVADAMPRLFDVFDEPLAAINVFALVDSAGLTGARLLDGSGADGLLGVPPPPRARYAHAVDGLLPAPVRRSVASACSRSPLRLLRKLGWMLEYERFADLLVHHAGWRSRTLVPGCAIERAEHYRLYDAWKDRTDLFGLYSLLYSTAWGADEVIPKSAVAGRRLGNVVRFPFEDIELRRTLKSLPRAVKYRDGRTKVVLRAILADHVPPALFERRKQGFGLPIPSVLRHGDHQLIHEYLDVRDIERQGLVDAGAVRDSLSRFLAGDTREARRLWAVLLLQLFLRVRAGA